MKRNKKKSNSTTFTKIEGKNISTTYLQEFLVLLALGEDSKSI
jgi:hypothetical protein